MYLKPIVCIHHDFLECANCEFSDRGAFQKYMSELFNAAYFSTIGKPIITLKTRLIGDIDGHKIKSIESNNGLKIFVSEDYATQNGHLCTVNRRTGHSVILPNDTVIVNRSGRQVYPPLSGRQKSELDKFTKNVFQTVYHITKTK